MDYIARSNEMFGLLNIFKIFIVYGLKSRILLGFKIYTSNLLAYRENGIILLFNVSTDTRE